MAGNFRVRKSFDLAMQPPFRPQFLGESCWISISFLAYGKVLVGRSLVPTEKEKSSKSKENDSWALQLGKTFHWTMVCDY